jgi:hypothetical protein
MTREGYWKWLYRRIKEVLNPLGPTFEYVCGFGGFMFFFCLIAILEYPWSLLSFCASLIVAFFFTTHSYYRDIHKED